MEFLSLKSYEEAMNSHLLRYYHEVLGLNFLPKDLLSEPLAKSPAHEVVFWRESLSQDKVDIAHIECDLLFISSIASSEQESIFQEPYWTLFEKMKNAMGLAQINVKTLEYVGHSENELFHDLLKMKVSVVLLMKENPERGDFKVSKEFKFLETYSPQIVFSKTELKKNSWDDLQKVMKLFKN